MNALKDQLLALGIRGTAMPMEINAPPIPPSFPNGSSAKWGVVTVEGVAYDLSHLDPFQTRVPPHEGGPEINMRVRFGTHVFTKGWRDNYPVSRRILDGKTPRCFCPERAAHSAHLPDIIRQRLGERVLFSKTRRLVFVGNPTGAVFPYAVFFQLFRASKKPFELEMLVVSAHEKANCLSLKGMAFPHLATIVAGGRDVPWPKK